MSERLSELREYCDYLDDIQQEIDIKALIEGEAQSPLMAGSQSARGLRHAALVAAAVIVLIGVVVGGWVVFGPDDGGRGVVTTTDPPDATHTQLPTPLPEPAAKTSEPGAEDDETSTEIGQEEGAADVIDSGIGEVWRQIEPPLPSEKIHYLASSNGVAFITGVGSDTTFATSSDGSTWTTHNLPDGLQVTDFAAGDDRWAVVAAGPPDELGAENSPRPRAAEAYTVRAFVSDDRGASWTELELDLAKRDDEGFGPSLPTGSRSGVTEDSTTDTGRGFYPIFRGSGVAVTGSTVAFITTTASYRSQAEVALLEEAGVLEPGEETCDEVNWIDTDGVISNLSFTICPSEETIVIEDLAVFGPDRDAIFAAIAREFVQDVTILASFDDGPIARSTTLDRVSFHVHDHGSMVGLDGGLLMGGGERGGRVFVSSDTRTWTEFETGLGRHELATLAVGPNGLWLAGTGDPALDEPFPYETVLLHSSDGAAWTEVATLTGIYTADASVPYLVGGPSGLAMVATRAERDEAGRRVHIVGWSADGLDWRWQTVSEAFGVDNRWGAVQLAVTLDGVIAVVDRDDGPPRWFATTDDSN